MILVELQAAVDAAGTLQTFYLSSDDFVTKPTDTPANIAFDNVLKEPGSIGVSIFADSDAKGGTKLELGEVIINNKDGSFDSWLDYGFDGRNIIIRKGVEGAAYPAGFTTLFNGTMQGADIDWSKCIIQLRDKQYLLNKDVLDTFYAGTNALPNGAEGTANDLKGQPKPRVYGKVFYISPPCVNTSKLTYQVNDGVVTDIPAVYDRGAALTKGANYANLAALEAAAPAAASYITCFALGLFRLGSLPAGSITADVTEGTRTAGDVINLLATKAGIGSVTNSLNAKNSAEVGVFIGGGEKYLDVMDTVASSVGGFYYFDATSTLIIDRFEAPTGVPAVVIEDFDTFEDFDRRSATDDNLPVWSISLNHSKVWAKADEFAGSVTAPQRAFFSEEYRGVKAEDATVKNKHLFATALEIDTLLVDATAAQTEADRLLVLYKTRRDVFEFSVEADFVVDFNVQLNKVVQLTSSRFGLSGGKLFRVLGLRLELAKNRVFLSLWG